MATYEITSPEGEKFRITAPDDATPEAVQRYAMAMQKRAPAAAPAAEVPGALQSALIAGGQGMDKMAAGLRAATPAPIRGAIDWANNALGMGEPPSIDPQVQADNQAAMKPLQDKYPLTTGLAEAAPMMAGGPLGMAAMAGLSYGTPQEKMMNAAGAYLGGKGGELLGKGVSKLIQPAKNAASDFVGATKALFDKYGLSALPSQAAGSKPLGWLESTVANLPGGGSVREAIAAQQQGLNRTALEAIGGEGNLITPEAVQSAKGALGAKFSGIPKDVSVAIDDTLLNKLGSVESDYMKNLGPDQKSVVKTYIDDIIAHGDTMPGDVYQKARSRIAARANSTQDSELKSALTGIYKGLDDAFNRSATPEAGAAMQEARSQWRLAKTIEPMANVEGNISPARLATGAKNLPGVGGDLAQIGARLRPLQDSGTAQRLMYQAMLSGGVGAGTGIATGNPMDAAKYGAASFAAPLLASKVLTSGAFKKYLENGLLKLSPEAEKRLIESLGVGGGLLGLRAAGQFSR